MPDLSAGNYVDALPGKDYLTATRAGWQLSNKLAAEFPQLSDPVLAGKVVSAIREALTGQTGEREGE